MNWFCAYTESIFRQSFWYLSVKVCYERANKSGFCALYVNRLNEYLFTIHSKGLYKKLIIEVDNKKCILKYCWCWKFDYLHHVGVQNGNWDNAGTKAWNTWQGNVNGLQKLRSKVPLEVSEARAGNITVPVLSLYTQYNISCVKHSRQQMEQRP